MLAKGDLYIHNEGYHISEHKRTVIMRDTVDTTYTQSGRLIVE